MPYVKKTTEITHQASMRLAWMDFIDKYRSIPLSSRHFHIPYRTVKYWRDRYNRWNLSSLENRSKRPKRLRKSEVTTEIKSLVLEVRMYILPGSGKVTIQKYLEKKYQVKIGQSRIQKIINETGLKRKKMRKSKVYRKNRKHMYSVPKKYLTIPGGLIYLDVKHLRFGSSKWYQFTALDHATRMLKIGLYRKISCVSTVSFFKKIREEYPFERIMYVGTDNGSEFLGEFDDYLRELSINHVFSSPSSPKQNPFVERVIRTIIDQQYCIYGLEDTPELQKEALSDYCYKYNNIRPHHSLNYLTPMEMYDKLSVNNSLS